MNRQQDQDSTTIWETNIKSHIKDAYAYREFTETIPVMVYAYRNSRVIYVNPAVEKALGYSFEEMLEKDYWDICHPDYKELIKNRGIARLKGEKVPSNYEFIILKKNGEEIWVDVFFGTTSINGETISIVGAYDITERKLLKEQLQAARDELETRVQQRTEELSEKNQELILLNKNLNNVVMNMSDGVVVVNRDGEFEMLNSVIEQTWGDLLGTVKDTMKDFVVKRRSHLINDLFNKRRAFQDEEVIFTTLEGPVHLLASGTPIVNEIGEVNNGVIILRPIKEIHKLVNRFSGAKATFRFEDIINCSEVMDGLIQSAKMSSSSMSNVLIEGESGTGKELFAQAIHNYSRRRKGPFIAINCGAIPRELIGSELFGYAEGAFTGARKGGNPGKFELASGGTLFLDEIGDMAFEQQAALLRVIQEKTITRIGGSQVIPIDVRIICATNKNLRDAIHRGEFRQDLYYRLNVISINIPPLRERKEDIAVLFQYFIKNESYGNEEDRELIKYLQAYDWPGNVRELQNVVERMSHAAHGAKIGTEHLPAEVFSPEANTVLSPHFSEKQSGVTIREVRERNRRLMEEQERSQIIYLLDVHGGNVSRAAREMGISRTTLYKKMQQYIIDE